MDLLLPFRDNYALVWNLGGGSWGRETVVMQYIAAAVMAGNKLLVGKVLFGTDGTKLSSECSSGSWDCSPSVFTSIFPGIIVTPALSAAKWKARAHMHGTTTRILNNARVDGLSITDVFYAFTEQRDDVFVFNPVINLFAASPGNHQFHLPQAAQVV